MMRGAMLCGAMMCGAMLCGVMLCGTMMCVPCRVCHDVWCHDVCAMLCGAACQTVRQQQLPEDRPLSSTFRDTLNDTSFYGLI
jgi:hypothetical protein